MSRLEAHYNSSSLSVYTGGLDWTCAASAAQLNCLSSFCLLCALMQFLMTDTAGASFLFIKAPSFLVSSLCYEHRRRLALTIPDASQVDIRAVIAALITKRPGFVFLAMKWGDSSFCQERTLAKPGQSFKRERGLTGERARGGGVDTVAAVPALTAGDLIIRLPHGRARWRRSFDLLKFPLQYSAHSPLRPHLKAEQTRREGPHII